MSLIPFIDAQGNVAVGDNGGVEDCDQNCALCIRECNRAWGCNSAKWRTIYELIERMENYDSASENMKKILLDKGHADYAKMSAALCEISAALDDSDVRSAVSALMLANDKATGDVLSAKKRRFNKATANAT